MLALLMSTGWAFTADELAARVEQTSALRSLGGMGAVTPAIPASMYAEAADGEVHTTLVAVPGHKAKQAIGVGVVDVPIERFWAAVNDDASKPLYTKLSFTEVLEGGLCGERRVVFMYLPITMLSDRWWIVEARQNAKVSEASQGRVREMTWESQKDYALPEGSRARERVRDGTEIEFAKGAWWLTALDDGHTLVEYWTWTDPGGYVPAGLASSFAAGGIKDTFEQMTRLAKEGGRCPVR